MECPWQTPVPPLPDTVTREIPFPTDETEDGIVRMGWRGPSALDRYAMAAAGVLMEYLTDTPVAPIQRDLVEVRVFGGGCAWVGGWVLSRTLIRMIQYGQVGVCRCT